jgi:pimeloyl-ACP methyl ester carboxylesterase
VRVAAKAVKYQLYGVTVASAIALRGVRRSSSHGPPRISIELGAAPGGDPLDAFHSWRVPGRRSRPWLSIGRFADGYRLRFPDMADFEVSTAGDRITCRPVARLARSTLRHLLLDQVLPLALSRSGRLVLHASAVHIPRLGSVAFVGPTGCGKSTLAAALGLRGCQVMTDDCLVVYHGEKSAENPASLAVPGYPGLRLWLDSARGLGLEREAATHVAHYTTKRRLVTGAVKFRTSPSPISAVFVLGRRRRPSESARTRALGSRDRLMSLAPYTYVMDVEDRRQLSQMFRSLATLAAHVPIVRLSVPDSRRRVLETAVEVLDVARVLTSKPNDSVRSR